MMSKKSVKRLDSDVAGVILGRMNTTDTQATAEALTAEQKLEILWQERQATQEQAARLEALYLAAQSARVALTN